MKSKRLSRSGKVLLFRILLNLIPSKVEMR
nr:MAG TPA: hypothetical protein [Bacteriophage sp.]